jgi:hypothetical protein
MDAVKEAQTAFAPVLKEWAQGIPGQLTDLKSLERFAEEAQTMYGAGYALGLDPGAEVVAMLTGSISGGMPTLRSTTRRTRTRRRATARARGNGAGHPGPTNEQVLARMRKIGGPVTQSQLASHFGVTRQTIAKRLDALVSDGSVKIEGDGARKTWRAKELIPA